MGWFLRWFVSLGCDWGLKPVRPRDRLASAAHARGAMEAFESPSPWARAGGSHTASLETSISVSFNLTHKVSLWLGLNCQMR